MFKVNNKTIRTTSMTLFWWVFLLLTLDIFHTFSRVSMIDFEQVNVNWVIIYQSLSEKCPYSEFSWFLFSRIRTEYGEIRSICPSTIRMRENTDQKNSEYGQFLRSESISLIVSPRFFSKLSP